MCCIATKLCGRSNYDEVNDDVGRRWWGWLKMESESRSEECELIKNVYSCVAVSNKSKSHQTESLICSADAENDIIQGESFELCRRLESVLSLEILKAR